MDNNKFAMLLLAHAVKTVYPNTQAAQGHSDQHGFYYDFDFTTPIKNESLDKLEEEMTRLQKQDLRPECLNKSRPDIKRLFSKESYKLELLASVPKDENPRVVKFGNIHDFCETCCGGTRDFHGDKIVFKLIQQAGAYWKGDAKNKMLTRIYGVAFSKKTELDEYMIKREEALKRDHNKLGRELELFTTVDLVGQGLPHFMPKGARVLQLLQRFVEDEEERRGYMYVKTPLMAKRELYELSGHWTMYKDGMFVIGDETLDDEVFALRPMTCPFHFFIYKSAIRSYRDLPMRYGETSVLFRNESSGEMHGLTRMRQFTISEGHIIARQDQIQMVFDECLELANFMMQKLGIANLISYRLSKWDAKNKNKYIGDAKDWEKSQAELRKILVDKKLPFVEVDGDAAFYGPKIDIQARNVYGKEDTIITIQLDFLLADRYDMTYVDERGEKVRPIVVHRTSIGCYERTLALLIENTAGAFPTWLAPVQATITGISNKQDYYVAKIHTQLREAGIRVEMDTRPEKVGYKIREHTIKKVPYILVAGEREQADNKVSIRTREGVDLGVMTIKEVIDVINR